MSFSMIKLTWMYSWYLTIPGPCTKRIKTVHPIFVHIYLIMFAGWVNWKKNHIWTYGQGRSTTFKKDKKKMNFYLRLCWHGKWEVNRDLSITYLMLCAHTAGGNWEIFLSSWKGLSEWNITSYHSPKLRMFTVKGRVCLGRLKGMQLSYNDL